MSAAPRPAPPPLAERPAWRALLEHYKKTCTLHLRDLFAADAGRGERLTLEAAGLYLDYSKNRITDETITLLVRLANECGLRERTEVWCHACWGNTAQQSMFAEHSSAGFIAAPIGCLQARMSS